MWPRAVNDRSSWSTPVQKSLPLAHDGRIERAVPVRGHVDLHRPYLVQHRLGPRELLSSADRIVLVLAEVPGDLLAAAGCVRRDRPQLTESLLEGERPIPRLMAGFSSAGVVSQSWEMPILVTPISSATRVGVASSGARPSYWTLVRFRGRGCGRVGDELGRSGAFRGQKGRIAPMRALAR